MLQNYPKEVFRAYDIRGVYPTQIDEKFAEELGKAIGTFLLERNLKNIIVGRDDRPMSYAVMMSLISGLLSTGVHVTNTSITVQPALHYFTFLDGIDASINITASHNPGSFSGVKIDYKHARPCFGEDIQKLYNLMVSGAFSLGSGDYREEDYNPRYIKFISSKFSLGKKIKVVVYCGNGATSLIYPQILEKIGAAVVPLRCYFDDKFPDGMPDPESGKFYPELRQQIFESHASIGVGFDSDGDRLGEMDEAGHQYQADQIVLLLAKDMLSLGKGGKVIYDVKCSRLVPEIVTKLGGTATMLRTGRSYFLNEMFSGNADLGVEYSGHLYFKRDYMGFDDGIFAACKLLEIMDKTGKKLSELMHEFPTTSYTPEIKITCDDKLKFEVIKQLQTDLVKETKYLSVDTTDGVRVKFSETAWFLIRASNTSNYLSIRAEAKDPKELELTTAEIAKLLSKFNIY